MVKEVLKWGGRPMTKSEVEYLNRSLDEIAIRIGQLAQDIQLIASKIREGLEYQKEFHKGLCELNEMLSGERLINIEKGLQKFRMQLIKKAPMYAIHDILKGEFKNKDVVKLMEEIYKQAQQQQMTALPPTVIEILRGKKKVSDYAVEVMKKMEAESRAS